MIADVAFTLTDSQLKLAIPAGVITGAIVGALASYFGARAAGKASMKAQLQAATEARRLAFDSARFERCANIYEDVTATVAKFSYVGRRPEPVKALADFLSDRLGAILIFSNQDVRTEYKSYQDKVQRLAHVALQSRVAADTQRQDLDEITEIEIELAKTVLEDGMKLSNLMRAAIQDEDVVKRRAKTA